MRGLTLIELIIVIAIVIIVILGAIIAEAKHKDKEREEFMAYCMRKDIAKEDCRWEWKRLKNGEKSDAFFIIPMFMGR